MDDKIHTPENKPVQLDDIAKALGISKSTVSRAMSGKGRISDTTKQKVQEYIKQCDYQPNIIARGLAKSRTYNICLALPDDASYTSMPFYQVCMIGISQYAAVMGYDVIVTTTNTNDISNLIRIIRNHKVDGVVLTRMVTADKTVNYLRESGIPFVVIGNVGQDIHHVNCDYAAACYDLTSYLLTTSEPSKIGIIMGNMQFPMNISKFSGCKRAFANAGQTIRENMIICGAETKLLVEQSLATLLNNGVNCILCGDDNIANFVIPALQPYGRIIGRDLKLASFNNNAYLQNNNPPITTVQINIKEFGEAATRNLIALINGEQVPMETMLDYEVLIKKSTN